MKLNLQSAAPRIPFTSFVNIVAIGSILLTVVGSARGEETLSLWPNGNPVVKAEGENEEIIDEGIGRKITKVVEPKVTYYPAPADKNTGACVVICPGGGYSILAYDLEGKEVADWLNGIGVNAAVVHYRVPRSKAEAKHEPPLRDTQRAIRVVRGHAEQWKLDVKRIGVLGFSAGGHLAAVASTNHKSETYEASDEFDKLSTRPDFTVLVYPAYLNGEPHNDSLELKEEVPVDKDTPPAIMIHANDDRVSPINSVAYYLALRKAKVPAELHIFPSGGHGYGLRPSQHAVTGWPAIVERWMRHIEVIK
jgi:acetyl esterase/lipase